MRDVTQISLFVLRGTLLCAFCALGAPAESDPVGPKWPQPGGLGSDVFVTYSYSNLLDGSYRLLGAAELRSATEEALQLWAAFAPIHFIEQADSGPEPSDTSYAPGDHPQIRIGHHPMDELAHAYYPDGLDGLGGDIHFDPGIPWTIGSGHWNFLEAIAHELGHAVGLPHEFTRNAIMNPSYPQQRFHGLGSAFLLPADIAAIQALYGVGQGFVQPIHPVPEPAALLLFSTALAALARARSRRS